MDCCDNGRLRLTLSKVSFMAIAVNMIGLPRTIIAFWCFDERSEIAFSGDCSIFQVVCFVVYCLVKYVHITFLVSFFNERRYIFVFKDVLVWYNYNFIYEKRLILLYNILKLKFFLLEQCSQTYLKIDNLAMQEGKFDFITHFLPKPPRAVKKQKSRPSKNLKPTDEEQLVDE